MYRNRKKMIIIGCTSVVVLAGFSVAAWAIIQSTKNVPTDSKVAAALSGNTIYLGNGRQFEYGKMSFNDWLLYNMPKTVKLTKSNDISTYTYYTGSATGSSTDIGTLIATVTYNEATKNIQIFTGNPTDNLELVNSTVSENSGSSLSYQNNYPVISTSTYTTTLTKSGTDSTYEYAGSSYKLSFSRTDSSSSDSEVDTKATASSETTTNTVEIKSNTNSTLWKKQTVTSNGGSNITETYTSAQLGDSSYLKVTYVATANSGSDSSDTSSSNDKTYSVTYYTKSGTGSESQINGSTTDEAQQSLLNFLGVISSTTSTDSVTTYNWENSKLSTLKGISTVEGSSSLSNELLYIPT